MTGDSLPLLPFPTPCLKKAVLREKKKKEFTHKWVKALTGQQPNHGRFPNCPFYSRMGGAANVPSTNASADGVEHT